MKKIVFCFDGTSNVLDAVNPTNVVTTACAVAKYDDNEIQQVVYYDQGVGVAKNQSITGGAFGLGLYANVLEAYSYLIFNYEPDDEIYIFGFSRGAYTARSFAGFIRKAGILKRRHADKIGRMSWHYQEGQHAPNADVELLGLRLDYGLPICVDQAEDGYKCERLHGYKSGDHPKIQLKYVGVWDTVKTLGLRPNSRKHLFHNDKLSSFVQMARHAISLDERRKKFDVTPWSNVDELNCEVGKDVADIDRPYQQVWFPGTHGGVGGGGDIRGLSDAALIWIWEGARQAGLKLDLVIGSKVFDIMPDPITPIDNMSKEAKRKIKSKNIGKRVGAFGMKHVLIKHDRSGPYHPYEVHETAVILKAAPANTLPDKKAYNPKSLNKVLPLLEDRISQYSKEDFYKRLEQDGEYENGEEVEIDGEKFKVHTIDEKDSRGLSLSLIHI